MNNYKVVGDLEWINGKTKITVEFSDGAIDVNLYTDYPNRYHLNLYLTISQNRVTIEDLVGNGFKSGLQQKGFGKQIVNVGIQSIRKYFQINEPQIKHETIKIYGKTSDQDDPGAEPFKTECMQRRNAFWSNFGLHLQDSMSFCTKMRGFLSELELREDGMTANGVSVLVNLCDFWAPNKVPLLNKYDVAYLETIDFSQFDINELPSLELISQVESKYQKQLDLIGNTYWLVINLIVILTLSTFNTFIESILYSLPIMFFSYFLTPHLSYNWRDGLSSYHYSNKLKKKRNNIRDGIQNYIWNVEKEKNGFIWRVFPYLCDIDPLFCNEKNEIISKLSRENCLYNTEYYLLYIDFIAKAKRNIIKRVT